MLLDKGYIQIQLKLPENINRFLDEEDYNHLDISMGDFLKVDGLLYNQLSKFISIEKTEHIIAIRKGGADEDGIWHDDGSRELAFTLSLTRNPETIIGGNLLLRKKEDPDNFNYKIPTAPYGMLTIIQTGRQGFEHRVEKVSQGTRIICAGWIN